MIDLQKKNKLHKLSLLLAVNLVLVILFISILELASFLLNLNPSPGGHFIADTRLSHTWRPNNSFTHREWIYDNPEFQEPYIHYYNKQGWLEKYDIQKKKPKSTYRIFYVGDSFTEGTCPMNKSVPSIVERKLNELKNKGNRSFEVINTGTSGYSPTIFYLLIRYALTDYSPDLIVVNIDMTDDFDDWKYNHTLIRDSEGNPQYAPKRNIYQSAFIDTENGTLKATRWTKLLLFLAQHSYTYKLILNAKRKVFGTKSKSSTPKNSKFNQDIYQRWAWCQDTWDDKTTKHAGNTLDILRRLAVWSQQKKIKLMFTGVPHYWQYSGKVDGSGEPLWSSRPHYEIANLAKEFGIPYLNSYEKLKPIISGTPQTDFYYRNNMHFNPRGYAKWAEAHVEFLTTESNKLLCDGC